MINEAVDKMDANVRRLHDDLVFLRKEARCHLNKMAEDIAELRQFYDEFGSSGAGVRKPFKFQCLSCDRKLLISPSEYVGFFLVAMDAVAGKITYCRAVEVF